MIGVCSRCGQRNSRWDTLCRHCRRRWDAAEKRRARYDAWHEFMFTQLNRDHMPREYSSVLLP